MRAEIQYLRAAAVCAVLLYHLWPNRIPGGYAGVDIFFVISGFLITSQLVRGMSSAEFSFATFYARRARRILPSALVVLAATALAVVAFVGLENWSNFFREILASTLFVENWILAADSVDYLAQDNDPSPVQHYWSLAVEEQFYLAWPLLLWATFGIARRAGSDARRAILWSIAATAIASLVASILITMTDPAGAYFSTVTRVWEFAAGGLLAVVLGSRVVTARPARIALQVVGWGGVAATMILITPETPFPGYAALLPVGAALLVIAAGVPDASIGPQRIARPILIVAEISFALYLWHWPLIVIADQLVVGPLDTVQKIVILGVSFVLAWLTTRYVEMPIRRLSLTGASTKRMLVGAGAALAVVSVFVASLLFASYRVTTTLASAADAQAVSVSECVGAGFLDPANDCDGVTFEGLAPTPLLAVDDKPLVYSQGCWDKSETVITCTLGQPGASTRVALLGDSHAIALSPALDVVGKQFDWSIDTYFKSACPFFSGQPPPTPSAVIATCFSWNANVSEALGSATPYDLAFVTYSDGLKILGAREEAVESFRQAWQPLIARGTTIVVIRDFPGVGEGLDCLIKSVGTPEACAVTQASGESEDYAVAAAEGVDGVVVVDLTDLLCRDGMCQVAVGGVTVYRDSHHLTKTFSETLAPTLARRLDEMGLLK